MRKLTFMTMLFLAASFFSFAGSKTVIIDNLYKIEFNYDFASDYLELRLFSENTATFDEQYATDCIAEELAGFLEENRYSSVSLSYSTKDADYEGKYTLVKNIYKLIK